MVGQRLNPEQVLKLAQEEGLHERGGKLKIYLGAAPGVGKTYKMLHDAYEKRAKGLDVVIGVAESHGREDIDTMLSKFEILPRAEVPYHGQNCLEFDLDAALKRHPGLILVDEMAHTNAPDMRHAKRWQDIKELLDRGIDVYTTINVQHIESLNDDIVQIIQAPIKETVPDSMIERADTIELVDIAPDELLKRLQEGKIYFPQQAELALEHFFRKGNLIALRELALRTTAGQVGTEVLLYRQGEGIKQIWPTKDKILVCVGPNLEALKLIRAAKRMAKSFKADWMAVYIDIPWLESTEKMRNRAIQNLRLAELLGAQTRVLIGFDVVKEIMNVAHEENVTQIMVWKHIHTRWSAWFHRSVADEMVRHSGEIDVYIMTGEASEPAPQQDYTPLRIPWKIYGITLGVMSLATALSMLLSSVVTSNIILIYLLGVMVVAWLGRVGPTILASVLSGIIYTMLFTSSMYFFSSVNLETFIAVCIMLLLSLTMCHLRIKTHHQNETARLVQHQTTALYSLNRQLMSTRGIDKLLELGTSYIANVFNSEVQALLYKGDKLELQLSHQYDQKLDSKEQGIAEWVYRMSQAAGFGTDTLSFSEALYLPLLGSQEPIGVLRVQPRSKQLFTPEQMGLLESCISQMALALEVDRLQEKTRKKELRLETERALNNLLLSISEDLCDPLHKVIQVMKTVDEEGAVTPKSVKNIDCEIEKLSRLNNNFLQITKLESKLVELQKTLASIKIIITQAIKLYGKPLKERPIQLNIPENLPRINLDRALIHQALTNLLDNALKFSPPKSPIHISVMLEQDKILVSIEDFGTGVDLDEKHKLFKKFYRGKTRKAIKGLGIGLTISKKIIEIHGGSLWVENIDNQGAAFRFTLPL